MKHLVKSLCAVVVLGATGVLLLADSAEKCSHAQQNASFSVSEGCGPAGTLSLSVSKDACYLDVSGADALQLPSEGRFTSSTYDLIRGSWNLTGTRIYDSADLADGGWPSDGGHESVTASRECVTAQDGDVLKLQCTDRAESPSDAEPRVLATCEATLTPQ